MNDVIVGNLPGLSQVSRVNVNVRNPWNVTVFCDKVINVQSGYVRLIMAAKSIMIRHSVNLIFK